MTSYVLYEIETLQPLKMGGTGSQADNETALDYIAGSTLRGAWIAAYLKQNKNLELHLDDQERLRWLEGKIRFLNAYPVIQGHHSWPFPTGLFAEKDELRLFYESGVLTEITNELLTEPREGMKRLPAKGFMRIYDDRAEWYRPKTSAQLHINLQETKTQLYRYESISPGQTFLAVVVLEEKSSELEEFMYSFLNKIIYLGGAKTSGYGKCKINKVKIAHKNPELFDRSKHFNGEFFVYCLSDILVRNEMGTLVPSPSISMLEQKLQVKLTLEKSSVQTILTTGFNNKWGTRLPQKEAIQKGSLYHYTYDGELDPKLVEELQNSGIGERRVDGYGRIAILPHFDIKRVSKTVISDEKQKVKKVSSLDSQDIQQMNLIVKRIMFQRIRDKFGERILEWIKGTIDHSISATMLSVWMERLDEARKKSPVEGKKLIKDFWDNQSHTKTGLEIRQKINNRAKKLERASILGKPWPKMIIETIERSTNVSNVLEDLNIDSIELEGISIEFLISSKEMYRFQMDMLYQYLRERRRVKNSEERTSL